MSFSHELKQAIMKDKPKKPCCVSSFLDTYHCAMAKVVDGKTVFSDMNTEIFNFFSSLGEYDISRLDNYEDTQYYCMEVPSRDCCRRSIMCAAFLCCGTMSNPESGYHLEFSTKNQALCDDLSTIMFFYELMPKVTVRRKNFVIYFKNSDHIADAIAAFGAYNIMVEFWDIKLEKEKRNNANRAVNCDSHNLDKTIAAAFAQVEAIREIDAKIGIDSLPLSLSKLCRLRLENKSANLADLGQALNPPIGKSAVSNRMRRIMQIRRDLNGKQD